MSEVQEAMNQLIQELREESLIKSPFFLDRLIGKSMREKRLRGRVK